MIDLTWREIRQVFVEEDTLYSALLYVYRTYIGDENDSIDEIIEGIQDNIENYIEELIKEASPYEIQMLKILQSQLPKMNSQRNLKNGTKMSDEVELQWTLNESDTFTKYEIFEALADLFDTYEIVPENVDYSSYVINWLNTNLKDFVEDFLTILYPMMDINEKVDYCNITNLLDNEEFIKEFKLYLGD